jgi:hypothetical protein
LHATVQAPFTQAGVPLGSVVVHTWVPPSPAHPPQLPAVLVVSTQAPLQSVGALDGQLAKHP